MLGRAAAVAATGRAAAKQSFSAIAATTPGVAALHTLVLMRHGQSDWNLKNLFTGWEDVDLTPQGEQEAARSGQLLKEAGYEFDVAYTSVLRRAIRTLWLSQAAMGNEWLPTHKDWRLNERHYGALTGLNKAETVEQYGEEQVTQWRRSYDVPPPALDEDSQYWPGHDRRYASVPKDTLPKTESLATTLDRVLPMWQDSLAPALGEGKRVLVVAHGNSLRALIKHLDGVSEKTITGINIPTGVPLVYKLDEYTLRPVPHGDKAAHVPGLSCNYVGDPEAIAAEVAAVAAQTKAK